MLVISFVTQKGGTGKSTVASSLAVAAHEAGEQVALLDLDPQQSLVRWSATRKKADIRIEAVSFDTLDCALEQAEQAGVTLCILDTVGLQSAMTASAIRACDLCIIPVRPNMFDLWAGEMTRRVIHGFGKACVFLLNQCPPAQQSLRVQEGVRALEAMGGLISPALSARVDFQDATRWGSGVTEINRYGQAADEIRKLLASIIRLAKKDVGAAESESHDDYGRIRIAQDEARDNMRLMSA